MGPFLTQQQQEVPSKAAFGVLFVVQKVPFKANPLKESYIFTMGGVTNEIRVLKNHKQKVGVML